MYAEIRRDIGQSYAGHPQERQEALADFDDRLTAVPPSLSDPDRELAIARLA